MNGNQNYNPYDFDSDYAKGRYGGETVGRYTAKAFLWMFLGLLVTFGVAVGVAMDIYAQGVFYTMFSISGFHLILLVAELAVVIWLSARINKISVSTARVLFLVYAMLNGIVFSAYFILFRMTSLILVFAATALYFGVVAAYGYLTKADLSGLRTILVSGLIFLIIFGVISLFLPFSNSLERLICLVGIAIFLGFTAYDTQKIKAMYWRFSGDPAMLQKASIFSALQLYLDFINLFLYLLRFMGRNRN